MSTTCAPLTADRTAQWDAYVEAHPHATFFHRAAWSRVLAAAFGHESLYLLAVRNNEVRGVLPLMRVKSLLFGHRLISTPFCVYGGPLASDQDSTDVLLQGAADLLDKSGAESLELRYREPPLLDAGWAARDDLYATFRKPITANEAENLQAIPRKQRAVVRKSLAGGLTCTANQDVDLLHRVYAESVRNLGTPVFPRRYFRLLREAFADSMDVVSVADAGQVHAAVMNFYWRDEVLPYYGGGTRDARASHANDLMYWEVMRRAAASGARTFDFGRSKRNTGAYDFKKNWGFPATPLLHRFRLRADARMPDLNPLNPSYSRVIAAWKRLPLPVANLLGPAIVRGTG